MLELFVYWAYMLDVVMEFMTDTMIIEAFNVSLMDLLVSLFVVEVASFGLMAAFKSTFGTGLGGDSPYRKG